MRNAFNFRNWQFKLFQPHDHLFIEQENSLSCNNQEPCGVIHESGAYTFNYFRGIKNLRKIFYFFFGSKRINITQIFELLINNFLCYRYGEFPR